MANPDDTTLPGEDFLDTLAAAPVVTPRLQTDAPDRLVFFFGGFDPRSATFHHRLFRTGIAQRNAASDETLALGKRQRVGRWASVWTALWRGAPSVLSKRPPTMRTRIHFMRWDDIVRQHWRRTPARLVHDYWQVYARGLSSGVLWRVWRAAPRAFSLAMVPLAVCGISFALGLGIAGELLWLTDVRSPALVAAIGLGIGAATWRGTARWFDCEWLLRLCAFTHAQALGQVPSLDARLEEMAERLVEAVEVRVRQPGAGQLREVMVVGYSSGSIMAASVLARAMPRLTYIVGGRKAATGTNTVTTLSFATLGQCIPIAAEWPGAIGFRGELELLSESSRLTWHDYASASDPSAFWRSPPWPQSVRMKGRQASPTFDAAPGIGRFGGMWRHWRQMHLRYLRADRAGKRAEGYDFFDLVCGPWTLAERHAQGLRVTDGRGLR